jgi:hypothetical protein
VSTSFTNEIVAGVPFEISQLDRPFRRWLQYRYQSGRLRRAKIPQFLLPEPIAPHQAIWALEVERAWILSGKIGALPVKYISLLAGNIGYLADECIVGRRLRLIFARISTADTPGVCFDFSQCGVERGVRPFVYAGHSFQGVARGIDHELMGGVCRDAPHRAAEQVRQPPNSAFFCGGDDHIQSEPFGLYVV